MADVIAEIINIKMAAFAEPTDAQCGICLEDIVDAYTLDCAHKFCRDCINAYKEHGVNDVCPYCRAPLPPGFAYSLDQCHQMGARVNRYEAEGITKKASITRRLQLHHAQKAVNANPKDASARFYLALGLDAVNQDFDGAIREYRLAVQFDPEYGPAHYNLGILLENVRNDYDGAEHSYREATRCEPDDSSAHNNLGNLLENVRKDHDGAEREYREALRCDPNCGDAHYNFGILLHTVRKDYAGAEREYREALRCDPDHAKAHLNLGSLLGDEREDFDGAMREFREAIRCDPNREMAHALLGCLIMRTSGDCDAAEHEFREVLRIDPNHADCRRMLQLLLGDKATPAQARPARPAPLAGELRVGLGVVLFGLSSAKFNGARGAIVSGVKDGRWGVQLVSHGSKAMAIKTGNIRITGA
jgi:tetratricopeptide (TPR) repeat protein